MADKLFRDYFNEKVTDTVLPANAKVLIQDGTGEPTQINAASISTGQLVKVTENGKTGYRLKDADPANYGDIGDDAVDLSISQIATTTKGATGDYATASGLDTTASGDVSQAGGEMTTASGQVSRASGSETMASGNFSDASGVSTLASGDVSKSLGFGTFARSLAEFCGGIFPTDYTPQSETNFDLTDRLVNYGNGTSAGNRSDAYTLFKNGMQKFFTAALSTITNAVKGSVMLDENARMHIHDGSAFKEVAFTDEITAVSQLETDIVKGASYFNDFDGAQGNNVNDGTFTSSALSGGIVSLTADPGFEEDDLLLLEIKSAINSSARFFNSNLPTVAFKNVEYRIKVRVRDFATSTDKYLFMFGRANSSNIISTSTCYAFIYDKSGDFLATASDNWLAVTKNGANSTIVDTGIPVIDSAYVRLMIKYTPTSIDYFINGVLVATIITNIVTNSSQDIVAMQKIANGTITQRINIDYYARTTTKITPRIYDN